MVTKKQYNKFYNIIKNLHDSGLVDVRISGNLVNEVADGKIKTAPVATVRTVYYHPASFNNYSGIRDMLYKVSVNLKSKTIVDAYYTK